MSFRMRLIVVSALAVAAAIALVSGTVYLTVRNQLYRELDNSLKDRTAQATTFRRLQGGSPLPDCSLNVTKGLALTLGTYYQSISSTGQVRQSFGLPEGVKLPVYSAALGVATHRRTEPVKETISLPVSGKRGAPTQRVRVLTSFVLPACAIQVARPTASVTDPLRTITVALLAVGLGGIGLATVFGWIIAGAAMRPVRSMTETSEYVSRTRDLSRRIEMRGRDELARLAASFNTMLEALDFSLRSQRQLVADASHELRTPLTTIKTNVEVLRRATLPKEEQDAILRDVVQQIDELAVLVTDIVDLARGVEPNLEVEDVRLDLLVEETVARARRLSPQSTFTLELEPCLVRGVPSRLERAVANLLDNATKWSPPEAPIEVTVRHGAVSVRDHGQGIEEEDLPLVFDRFYRAAAARALPGSGLGLAIVRQVAESHSGRVSAERPSDGGALLRLELPEID
ncbi:MAG: HAMP domain-containing sensor histidine kinase [Gaiellaceae bacterium]